MPTYAYRGDQCGHEFEIRQSFSDDPVRECPTCGMPVRRVIHPPGIVFKGTGWYLTDSRPTTETSGGVHDANKVATKSGDDTSSSNGKTQTAAAPVAAATSTKES
jgi:putative FmdB family regulatory protein